MPIKRLARARASLPAQYQFGDAGPQRPRVVDRTATSIAASYVKWREDHPAPVLFLEAEHPAAIAFEKVLRRIYAD